MLVPQILRLLTLKFPQVMIMAIEKIQYRGQKMERIGLPEAIAALRQELIESIVAAQGEKLRFEVGEVLMEFQVEVEKSIDGKGGIKFWVVEMGAGATSKDKAIHKVTVELKPVRADGKPVLTGSDEIPE